MILIVMFDVIKTTLTTKGEGFLSAIVSGGFRNLASLSLRAGGRVSEIMGAVSVLAIGSTWLAGLWAGWVLVFLGLPNAIEHSTHATTVGIYDYVYFVGFTLSTLGVGDFTPNGTLAQMATTLSSFNGLLVITLIVTYAVSVVSGVVARRVLAYKIYLAGGDEGDFQTRFESVDDFVAWIKDIRNDLIFCTEQRLAYPVLDNFLSKEKSHSLAVQLTKLGLASQATKQSDGVSEPSRRELDELFSVLYRYTSLTGITDNDLLVRLRKLSDREGWSEINL
ncbi:ion channel [Haliea sp. E1-2-M8]|uniref:ion channel n=1 Tax=Haliea sp. E1-2-M8 TaxID=3064706 RepID=UPI00271D9591|nr:ion channel [Haliea sp. E1-2-M8]MDO8862383.1 ion channel [Haliea sp. E1-2-M8]